MPATEVVATKPNPEPSSLLADLPKEADKGSSLLDDLPEPKVSTQIDTDKASLEPQTPLIDLD